MLQTRTGAWPHLPLATSGYHSVCTVYALGSATSDSTTPADTESIDPNNHVKVSFEDALRRTHFTQQYSGLRLSSLSSNIVQQQSMQYNALGVA